MRPSTQRERRRHVVYITLNTEYHCRDRECVGVRDRQTGAWQRQHPALRGNVLGSLHPDQLVRREPRLGLRLVFEGKRRTVMTSRVLFAGRPERESVFSYTSLARAGMIQAYA